VDENTLDTRLEEGRYRTSELTVEVEPPKPSRIDNQGIIVMENRITLLLSKQPGVLARATVALQPLGLKYRGFEEKDDTSQPGFTVVTLVAEGDNISEADLNAKLKEINGVVEVLKLVHGGTAPQKVSTDRITNYLDAQDVKDTSSTSSLDAYFREQIRGLTNLIAKLQGQDKVQILLTDLAEAAAKAKWPAAFDGNGSYNPAEISPMQYRLVFQMAVNHAGELMGQSLVVKQLQAVEKRLRDSGEDVGALSGQLGVTDIVSI